MTCCYSKKEQPLSRNESRRFGTLKSDSTHHFFRNASTKSGSLRLWSNSSKQRPGQMAPVVARSGASTDGHGHGDRWQQHAILQTLFMPHAVFSITVAWQSEHKTLYTKLFQDTFIRSFVSPFNTKQSSVKPHFCYLDSVFIILSVSSAYLRFVIFLPPILIPNGHVIHLF
jgi:hypothetical protein